MAREKGPNETTLTKWIRDLLHKNGWWTYKIHGGGWSRAGIPDIIALKEGFHVWIEVKVPGNSLSKAQEIVSEELGAYGAEVIVAHDATEALSRAEFYLMKHKKH